MRERCADVVVVTVGDGERDLEMVASCDGGERERFVDVVVITGGGGGEREIER